MEVVCQGSPYDMGLLQGSALRSKIAGTLHCLRELEVFRLAKPAWLPFTAFRCHAERKVQRLWVQP